MTACTYGDADQTTLAQYPCPGGCGCYVLDGNLPCLACWFASNSLTEQQARARRLPADHPRVITDDEVEARIVRYVEGLQSRGLCGHRFGPDERRVCDRRAPHLGEDHGESRRQR